MKKILVFAIFTASMVTVSFAGQCPYDSNYNWYNGHRQVSDAYLLTDSQARNITVCSVNLNSNWRSALSGAVSLINGDLRNTGTSVKFRYVSGASCMIPIETKSFGPGENPGTSAAKTYSPPERSYRKIWINRNLYNLVNTFNKRQYILSHEMLHAIGVRHTGTTEGNKVPGSVSWRYENYDGTSLMCVNGKLNNYVMHLNVADVDAINVMY